MDKIKLVAILRGIRPAEAAEHIETLIKAGFRYIEIPLNSPDWQQSIPQMAARFGEQAVIGAGTVLKVEQVDFLADAGAKWLKIFPSSTFGPDYIRALKAVLPPEVPVLAVGGVTPENLASWVEAGCAGAGLGSDLYRAGQAVERTRQQAERFIAAAGG